MAATDHPVTVHLSAAELRWLQTHAARVGATSVSEALRDLVRGARHTRQAAARARLLEYLGDAARLEPGDEEAILREMRDG